MAGAGNQISGNFIGITGNTTTTLIAGNTIGLDSTGMKPLSERLWHLPRGERINNRRDNRGRPERDLGQRWLGASGPESTSPATVT